jgi:hypothetical protein
LVAKVAATLLFTKVPVQAEPEPVQVGPASVPAVFDHDDTYAPVPVPPLPEKAEKEPGYKSVSVTVAVPLGLATE